MNKSVIILMMALVLAFALSVPAQAQKAIGGHDETTEPLATAFACAGPTPGTGNVLAGSHLLISEIGLAGMNAPSSNPVCRDTAEFLEIYNPTSKPVDLSKYYISDVNAYDSLAVTGKIDIYQTGSDFAMKFPDGSSIAAGAYKVVAVDGGRYKRCTGVDADFMMFNAGGVTTALYMVDVAKNKPGTYPTFGSFTNTAEFTWLFFWDGISDLVCDVDLAVWGSGSGSNWPRMKTAATCVDGPDADGTSTCYNADAGTFTAPATCPNYNNQTLQRSAGEGAETLTGGNGCIAGGPTAVTPSTWGHIKSLYR